MPAMDPIDRCDSPIRQRTGVLVAQFRDAAARPTGPGSAPAAPRVAQQLAHLGAAVTSLRSALHLLDVARTATALGELAYTVHGLALTLGLDLSGVEDQALRTCRTSNATTLRLEPEHQRLIDSGVTAALSQLIAAHSAETPTALADALAQFLVVTHLGAHTLGVDLWAVLAEIHATRMATLGRDSRPGQTGDGAGTPDLLRLDPSARAA